MIVVASRPGRENGLPANHAGSSEAAAAGPPPNWMSRPPRTIKASPSQVGLRSSSFKRNVTEDADRAQEGHVDAEVHPTVPQQPHATKPGQKGDILNPL